MHVWELPACLEPRCLILSKPLVQVVSTALIHSLFHEEAVHAHAA